MTNGVRSSACSRAKAAFRPGHAGHFYGTNTVRPSTAGYSARTVPRFASAKPLRRGLESDLLPRGTWTRSVRPSEAGVPRRGNSGRLPYESEWHEDVGFIPALKGGAFSSNLRNTSGPPPPGRAARRPPTRRTPRSRSRRRHHREQRDRGAWVERRDASFVSAGNRRFPACSQNAMRSADIAGRRPASGQNPVDSGTITRERSSLERQRVPDSEATASPRAVRAGLRPASRRRACRGRSEFLEPYLNTTAAVRPDIYVSGNNCRP